MGAPPEPSSLARRVLALARRDRAAAKDALAGLSRDEQVRLLLEAPLHSRARILELVDEPERLVPMLPEAELVFTAKAIGLEEAAWLLEHATPEQMTACVDLDGWRGDRLAPESLDAWLEAFAEAGDDPLRRALESLDPELLVLHLRHHVDVVLREVSDDWEPPGDAITLDGQFYLRPKRPGDDLSSVIPLLTELFSSDYWLYFRLLQGVNWELEAETREFARRWRWGRLQDHGFHEREEAIGVYGYLPREKWRELPSDPVLDPSHYVLPARVEMLPAGRDARHAVFRAVEELSDEERGIFFGAFLSLANDVAVADGLPLGEPDSIPAALEKAAELSSVGLEEVASETGLEPSEVLRRSGPARLFRVGANRVREETGSLPLPQAAEEDEEAGDGVGDDSGA